MSVSTWRHWEEGALARRPPITPPPTDLPPPDWSPGGPAELLGHLDVADVLAAVAIVADQPRQARPALVGGKSGEGDRRPEAPRVDRGPQRREQRVGGVERTEDLRNSLRVGNELGIAVAAAGDVRHASQRLGFGPDDVGDDGGDAVAVGSRGPVEGGVVETA